MEELIRTLREGGYSCVIRVYSHVAVWLTCTTC